MPLDMTQLTLPDKPLTDYSVSEARQAISTQQSKEGPVNQRFIDGDHWQEGTGWIGPMPTDANSVAIQAEIRNGFTSRNVILEVTERHSTGVIGREPDWGFNLTRDLDEIEKPSEAEQKLIDEAEALMTVWWDKRGIHTVLKNAVERGLHQGRAVLRIFVPKGLTVNGVATAKTVAGALELIYIDSPHPRSAAILHDPDTMREVGIVVFEKGNFQYVDFHYINDEGLTVVKRIGGENPDTTEMYEVDLGGKMLLNQIQRRLLITTQVQQQQRGLNLAESMIPRNVVTTGFLERIIFNAMLPGHYVDDENEPTGKRFVPDPYYAGAGTTNFLNGVKFADRDGGEQIANPSAFFRDPIPPKASIDATGAHYRNILNETDQLHHLISGDAISSAVSRVEARLDFTKSLSTTQAPTEAVGRWILEGVLALAEAVAGVGGRYTDNLQAYFRCRLQAGHLTPEEQTALMERVEKGLTTREEAMHLLGVDNVDIALAKINAQPGSMLDMRKKQAEVLKAWLEAGITIETAAKLTGFDEDTDEYKMLIAQKVVEEEEVGGE